MGRYGTGRRHRLALGQQGKGGKGKQPLLCTWTELELVPYLEFNKLSVAEVLELVRRSKPVKLNVFKASNPSRSQAPAGSKPGCYRHRALSCLLCFYLMVGREVNKMFLTTFLLRVNQASSESLCLLCQDLSSLCKCRTGQVLSGLLSPLPLAAHALSCSSHWHSLHPIKHHMKTTFGS